MKNLKNFTTWRTRAVTGTWSLLLLFVATLSLSSCDDNDDNANTPNANLEVQDFIWKGLNLWYFWQDDVNDLADDRFSSNEEYSNYLSQYTDPESFFYDQLLFVEDEFSYITDDYMSLLNSQQGNTNSNGVEFGLYLVSSSSNNVFGYVRYIVPGSDAAGKDISRGEFFTGVDGQTLTTSNYIQLLFGENNNYTLNMATLSGGTFTPNGKSVALTKTALTENPVLIAKSFDISGQKIGYIMYNQFTSNFDVALNNAFGQLKADGVTSLVLDLRYNPGGSVRSAVQLSSMITGQFKDQLFIRQRWNSKIQPQLSDAFLNDYFVDKLSTGETINSLNLNTVYIIALESSASASELVINGLNPYIDVQHIGENTRGKNEFSITLLDDPGNDYVYNPSRLNQVNQNHDWGMQPLVGRNENADGFLDYKDGLIPDTELSEDLTNLGVLGDANEPLLAEAISQITGSGLKFASKEPTVSFKLITGSNFFTPTKDNMYLEKEIKLNQ